MNKIAEWLKDFFGWGEKGIPVAIDTDKEENVLLETWAEFMRENDMAKFPNKWDLMKDIQVVQVGGKDHSLDIEDEAEIASKIIEKLGVSDGVRQ